MRRLIAVLASAALVVSLLSVPAAAVPIVSEVELTSARIVARGVAVDLTFKIQCDDFNNRVAIDGELKQVVRKGRTAVGVIVGDGNHGLAVPCAESMTTRVFASDWAFRRGEAAVTATASSCDGSDFDPVPCTEAKVKAIVQVTRTRQVPPKPTSAASGVLGVKLISTKLVMKGTAAEFRLKVTQSKRDHDSSRALDYSVYSKQVSAGRVMYGSVLTSYSGTSPNPHVITLRIPRPQGVSNFKARETLLDVFVRSYGGADPEAGMNGVVRLRR